MLEYLRRIIQEVNNAHDFNEALVIIVQRVREALETDACSVFLIDRNKQEYVLMATRGLNPQAVGRTRVGLSYGLIGWVGQHEEALNVENAKSHPGYYVVPDLKEEDFQGFLGVPILYQRKLYGVLAAQQRGPHPYTPEQESFLVTLSAQLGSILAHAEATGVVRNLTKRRARKYRVLHGHAAASRVGMGYAYIVYPPANLQAVPEKESTSPEEDMALFRKALQSVRNEISNLGNRLRSRIPQEDQLLFDAYLHILSPSGIAAEVEEEIRSGVWCQTALKHVIKTHIREFEAMDNAYLRERANDIQDLGNRILAKLQSSEEKSEPYPKHTILVGDEISPTQLAQVPRDNLQGIVSMQGSANSHVAILARALGVPAVLGISDVKLSAFENHPIIVDGYAGQVHIAPRKLVTREYERLIREEQALDRDLESLCDQSATTPDGHSIDLYVNTGLSGDLSVSLDMGAQGVGLFRTEVPFLMRDHFPSKDEQRTLYRQLLSTFAPRPVTMRTLDIGGDKSLPYFPIEEDNPFLGWRGIRITLDHPDIFLVQTRSMMRASESYHNLRIMLPMITDISEVHEALRLLKKGFADVRQEGFDIKMPEVGVMIEVPSAVFQAQEIAKHVDFLSVGSNDLTQYLLAVDRNNARVANLYDCLHPAVLRALQHVVEAGKKENIPVGICGEMAGDPVAAILLLAMGFDSLSLNAVNLARIKWVIRQVPLKEAKAILEEAMRTQSPKAIRSMIEEKIKAYGLGGLVRAGRY